MDLKKLQPASAKPRSTPPSRRRSYVLINLMLILGVAAIIFYNVFSDQRFRTETQPALECEPQLYHCDPNEPVKRVAIIGAGSAGSSAAYYLSKYTQPCSRINITVYERSSYIGGRSTTVDAYDDPSEPVELGASIFVKVNRNLVNAVKTFGLSTKSFASSAEEEYVHDLGIYDGEEWVYVQNNGDSYWWNAAKLLWKYGMAPLRTQKLMKAITGKFFKMYDAPHFPFKDLSQTVNDVGLADVIAVTGEKYLAENGISEKFARDLIQASTRVNYAQNLDTIHGLETMVCMATDGAMSVSGGNWRIFANMVIASGASVELNTSVHSIALQKDGTYAITTSSTSSTTSPSDIYDDIILAAPLQYTNLTFHPQPPTPPPPIPYVHLHVTIFTSPHRLSPHAFHLPATASVPATILTTLPKTDHKNSQSSHPPTPPFYSISTLRALTNPSTSEREYLYKIFSPAPISLDWLEHILLPSNSDTGPKRTTRHPVTWIYEKLWHSYPIESPRTEFENLIIELGEEEPPGRGVGEGGVNGRGKVWYTSGIEGFISTMETSSLMGGNVARLIVDGWIGEREGPGPGMEKGREEGERGGSARMMTEEL